MFEMNNRLRNYWIEFKKTFTNRKFSFLRLNMDYNFPTRPGAGEIAGNNYYL